MARTGVDGLSARDRKCLQKIEDIRGRNNVAWMDVVRVALAHAPKETRALLRKIQRLDGEVRRLTRELSR